MATTEVSICNAALAHLGEASITALTDDTARARACNQFYGPMRDAVLRSHRWNFAQDREALSLPWQTMTSVANSGGLVQVTKAGHGFSTGNRVQVKNTSFADGAWLVTVSSTSVFTLDGSVWSSGVVAGSFVLAPDFGWGYEFTLPTACLRVLEVNGSEEGDNRFPWVVEGRKLLTNQDTANLVYVKQVTDPTLFDPLFVDALSVKLAIKLSDTIRGATSKTEQLTADYERITAPLARRVDANEGRRRKPLKGMNSLAIQARFRGSAVCNNVTD